MGFVVDIEYPDMLQLIWPTADINTSVFFLYFLTETVWIPLLLN